MDFRRLSALGGAAVIVGALLAGCASTGGPSSVSPSAADPTAPVSTVSPSTVPADAKNDASAVALKAVSAFVDHSRPQDVWWADFSQYLASDAVYVWEGTRAYRVPASKVTGDPVATYNSGTSVSVLVPTDAGQYRLDMIRRVEVGVSAGPWIVFAMTPPAAS